MASIQTAGAGPRFQRAWRMGPGALWGPNLFPHATPEGARGGPRGPKGAQGGLVALRSAELGGGPPAAWVKPQRPSPARADSHPRPLWGRGSRRRWGGPMAPSSSPAEPIMAPSSNSGQVRASLCVALMLEPVGGARAASAGVEPTRLQRVPSRCHGRSYHSITVFLPQADEGIHKPMVAIATAPLEVT